MRFPLLAVAAATMTTALVAWAGPAQAGTFVVLSEGHVDVVDVAFEEGAFEIVVHDETVDPDVERDPNDVLFVVNPAAATEVPDDPRFAFLGTPGATVFILPQEQVEGLLFAGLATEELEAGVFVGDSITLRVKRVFGPDGFSMYTVDSEGNPDILADSENGLPDAFALPIGTHQHLNWAFEKAGFYLVKVDVTARLAGSNTQVTSEPAWLKFAVRSS